MAALVLIAFAAFIGLLLIAHGALYGAYRAGWTRALPEWVRVELDEEWDR